MNVCASIERITGQRVGEDMLLDELQIDSLEFMDMLIQLEQEAEKDIPDAKLPQLKTVGDIARELS